MILENYWVLQHPDGYLLRIAQRTDIDCLVDVNWKEAIRFQSLEHADNLRTMMRDKAVYNREWLFWNDMNPRHIKVEIT